MNSQPHWGIDSPQPLVLDDGRIAITWERIISDAVHIGREDLIEGTVVTIGPTTVHAAAPPEGLDVDAARRLAADLLAAVELAAG